MSGEIIVERGCRPVWAAHVPGVVKFWATYPDIFIDPQYGAIGRPFPLITIALTPLLTESLLTGEKVQRYRTMGPVPGTVVGIKAWPKHPPRNLAEVVEGLKPKVAPPIQQYLTSAGIDLGIDADLLASYGVTTLVVSTSLLGTDNQEVLFLTPPEGYTGPHYRLDISGALGAMLNYSHYARPQPPNLPVTQMYVSVFMQPDDGTVPTPTPFEPFEYFTLYHVIKQGTEITPPHLTKLQKGSTVSISTYPLANRELISFTVQGVEQLPGAVVEIDPDASQAVIDASGYKTGMASMTYGPVLSDVYVSSIATVDEEEFDVTAGIEFTKQFTTTDCYTDSWAISYSTLPEEVEISISATGLLKIYVPPDVYAGNPGGQYYIEITFKGYSETVVKYYKITLLEMPAFGNVWTAQGLLAGGSVKDIFVDSNDDIYITTATKVFKTTSELTTFTEMTLTGTIVSYLGNIQEVADGRLILSDRTGIWIKAVGSDEFVRQSLTLTNWSSAPAVRLAAGPDDNFFFVTHSSNTGLVTYIDRYNLDSLGAYARRYTNDETLLPFYPAPIRAAENVWCFMVGGLPSAGCALIRYADGVFTRLIRNIRVDTSGAGAGSFTMEDSGRIWLAVADFTAWPWFINVRPATLTMQVQPGLNHNLPQPWQTMRTSA